MFLCFWLGIYGKFKYWNVPTFFVGPIKSEEIGMKNIWKNLNLSKKLLLTYFINLLPIDGLQFSIFFIRTKIRFVWTLWCVCRGPKWESSLSLRTNFADRRFVSQRNFLGPSSYFSVGFLDHLSHCLNGKSGTSQYRFGVHAII